MVMFGLNSETKYVRAEQQQERQQRCGRLGHEPQAGKDSSHRDKAVGPESWIGGTRFR
jgi:hypothetical protein